MSEKEKRDYWSDCGQVFYCDGSGYRLANTLQTVYLGSEGNIKRFFETGELNDGLNSIERQVLLDIIEYRKEQG